MGWPVVILAYIVMAFLTYGHAYNNHPLYRSAYKSENATVSGVFWPVYWSSYPVSWVGRLAIEVTK